MYDWAHVPIFLLLATLFVFVDLLLTFNVNTHHVGLKLELDYSNVNI